jgi:hypothetical protein
MPYMLHERVVLHHTILEIELKSDLSYRLRYGDLVEYDNGRRKVRGRSSRYEFRSVEQLRYDFERDVASVGGNVA